MDSLVTHTHMEYKYQVFPDDNDNLADMDFETEEQRREYLLKFQQGEMCSYFVVQYRLCPCCEGYSHADSLSGIHARSPEEALGLFLSYNGE